MPFPITGSPDITILDFAILYDISGAIPAITLTNMSVGNPSGTTGLNLCTWWYVILSPNGSLVHNGSLASPDYPPSATPWTTLSIAPLSWPTPFGTAPCGQIEFSSSVPYICTLYVKDAAGTTYQYAKSTLIPRPNGNISETCGSFGAAAVSVQMQCSQANIYAADTTDYTYQGIIGTSSGNTWTMRYPQGASGVIPGNATATNASYVLFNIGYAGKGYVLYLNTYAIYNLGNECSVKIQYKLFDKDGVSMGSNFAVYCNIDLCKLDCKMKELYELLNTSCGEVTDPSLAKKVQKLQLLYTRVMTGIFQPLCGIDVPGIIEEMERVGGFKCDCACSGGINIGLPLPSPTSGGCCPISTPVINNATGIAPASCPNSYFSVSVMDPTHTTTIGNANNINDLVSILNATPSWQAYGTAFAEGNCVVGWYLSNPAAPPPNPHVVLGPPVIPPSVYVDPLIDIHTGVAPVGCPSGNPYPLKIYDPTHTVVIGIANSITEAVALINANGAWAAYGTASPQDTCHVQFNLLNAANIPPNVNVDPNVTSASCVSDQQNYLVEMIDPCYPTAPITASSFPCSANVDWGLGAGAESIGTINSLAALINALNIFSDKPASLTFSASTVTPNTLNIYNSNCTAYSQTPVITCDAGSQSYILFGANSTDQAPNTPTKNGIVALGLSTNSDLGRIPGATANKHMWHTILIQNYLIVAEGDTGKIYFYDVTNALTPSLVRIIQLNDTGSGNCFQGIPNTVNAQSSPGTAPSIYGLYFPTDYYAGISLNVLPVFESTTGSWWLINISGIGSGINGSGSDASLLGKCPRIYHPSESEIYFTQDGDLEQAGGLVSGVAAGSIVRVSIASSSTVGFGTVPTVLQNSEYVWGATYDGIDHYYFFGKNSSMSSYDITTASIDHYHFNVIGFTRFASAAVTMNFRANIKYCSGNIYITFISLNKPAIYETECIVLPVSSFPTTPTTTIFTVTGFLQGSFTFTPIGSCLCAITGYNGNRSYVLIYRLDGTFINNISVSQGQLYNVVAIPGYPNYFPNNFVSP